MIDVDGYLARIGMTARPAEPSPAALRELTERHLATVPFENLSIHLDEPIRLVPELLVDKIVRRNRGGFCYELNGAFATLLTELGYRVTLLGAQVYTDGGLGPPFDHLALRVDLDEPWLVDVGFGRFTRYPLRLAERGPQPDPPSTYRLVEVAPDVLDVREDEIAVYRLELRPRLLTDFVPTCWYQTTSPDSHFTWSTTCSRPTPTGRTTVADHRLIHTEGGKRTEVTLSDAELLAAYREHFGIDLDRVPTIRNPIG